MFCVSFVTSFLKSTSPGTYTLAQNLNLLTLAVRKRLFLTDRASQTGDWPFTKHNFTSYPHIYTQENNLMTDDAPKKITKSIRRTKEPLPDGWIEKAIEVVTIIIQHFLQALFKKWF